MNTRYKLIVMIGMIAMLALPVFAQEDAEEAGFVGELRLILERDGWPGEQGARFVTAARGLDWTPAEGADPEVIALALEFTADADADVDGLSQAILALELAMSAAVMEEVGFDRLSIARAALDGARNAISDIQAWRDGGREGNLGLIVREQVITSVRAQIRATLQERLPAQARRVERMLDDLPVPVVPGGRPVPEVDVP